MMVDRNLKYFDYMTDFGLKDTIKTVNNLDKGTYSIYYIPYRLTDVYINRIVLLNRRFGKGKDTNIF